MKIVLIGLILIVLGACSTSATPKPVTLNEYAAIACANLDALDYTIPATERWGQVADFMRDSTDRLNSVQPPPVLQEFHIIQLSIANDMLAMAEDVEHGIIEEWALESHPNADERWLALPEKMERAAESLEGEDETITALQAAGCSWLDSLVEQETEG